MHGTFRGKREGNMKKVRPATSAAGPQAGAPAAILVPDDGRTDWFTGGADRATRVLDLLPRYARADVQGVPDEP